MSDINVELDSSDIPVIIDALELLMETLEEQHDDAGPHPTLKQVDLLLNTFRSLQS
jgi:hypothetical protein